MVGLKLVRDKRSVEFVIVDDEKALAEKDF